MPSMQSPTNTSETVSTTPDGSPQRVLLPHHRLVLEEGSGIHPDVIAERGYWSAEKWQDLDGLGFKSYQKIPDAFPSLMIPHYDVAGALVYHVLRYDRPRITRELKAIKYEQPAGWGLRLDVPLRCLAGLWDPNRTLWFTEGAKKADALASRDIIAVNTPGVDGWRSPSAIPDLFGIPWKGRSVVIAYDSDVQHKSAVRLAMVALASWMTQRGADVSVIDWEKADLPESSKTGVDDYLAAGHDVDDLHDLLMPFPEWIERTKPQEGTRGCPYRVSPEGIEWLKPDKQGLGNPEIVRLTNFAAKISAEVIEDDGIDERRVFELATYLKDRAKSFRIPAEKYTTMNWVTEQLGASAIVYPGNGTRDHARAAVQLLSGEITETVRFTHLGWRKIADKWFYLHAGGAIGAEGAVEGIDVAITDALSGYLLPPPPEGEDLIRCVRTSLEILEVAPPAITVPLLAAPYRAVIGGVDHSLYIAGPTGAGKSVLAAFVQQHFGTSMDGRHLPAGWSSTGNALELLAFLAKDAVLTVDDFVPTGSAADVAKLNRDAERLFRGQGNQAGRQRMTADATLRQGKPPRGLVLSTGEDSPRGQSLRARLLILEVDPSDIDWARVGICQRSAADGVYARTLAGFIRWLAPRYDQVRSGLPARIRDFRSAAYTSNLHRRVPEIVANLAIGLASFLEFAHQAGAFTVEQCEEYWATWWASLMEPAAKQAKHQAATEPARRFLTLLGAALSSGQAHLSDEEGNAPVDPDAWGWRRHTSTLAGYSVDEWHPQGPRVGWIDADNVYLDPEAAYGAAQQLGARTGEPLLISSQTLRKRLKEQKFLASVDEATGTLTVRRKHAGQQRRVLHIHLSSLGMSESPSISSISTDTTPPPWRQAETAGKMQDSSIPMLGQMPGSENRENGKECKGDEAGITIVEDSMSSHKCNVGNAGNAGSSLNTPVNFSSERGAVSSRSEENPAFDPSKPSIENLAFPSIGQNPDSGGVEVIEL